MESIAGPVIAGIIVSLLNRYVLDFRWCGIPESWYGNEVVEVDDEIETDASSSSSTAISSDSILTHHMMTHVN